MVKLVGFTVIFSQILVSIRSKKIFSLDLINTLADRLTYYLNSGAYLKGEGIGSNYIAEMYDLGYIWLIIISILLGIAIIKYEKYVVKNRFLLLTSYYFIPNLFYIPRGSFFGEGLIKNMAMLIAVYVLVFSFDYMYRKIEEKKELI